MVVVVEVAGMDSDHVPRLVWGGHSRIPSSTASAWFGLRVFILIAVNEVLVDDVVVVVWIDCVFWLPLPFRRRKGDAVENG